MPVPWGNQQEQQKQQNDQSELKSAKEGRIADIGQEAVNLKLTWGPQDVNYARATGCLPRKAANREWNQSRR